MADLHINTFGIAYKYCIIIVLCLSVRLCVCLSICIFIIKSESITCFQSSHNVFKLHTLNRAYSSLCEMLSRINSSWIRGPSMQPSSSGGSHRAYMTGMAW